MNSIGGYFEFELNQETLGAYYSSAVAVNNGRNAFRLILKEREVQHIYVPYYTCKAVLEPIEDMDVNYSFYELNKDLEVKKLDELDSTSYLLYINYFGLKSDYIEKLSQQNELLIIDNSQAFFDKPHENIATFYSPRKFFGVPGGGYVFGSVFNKMNLERDVSYNRSEHLLIRLDKGAEDGYEAYQKNEKKNDWAPVAKNVSIDRKDIGKLKL